MGMVVVSRGGSVDESKTESDVRHAMANVNQLVADAVKDKRPDINHYAVEYLISKDEGAIKYLQDGKAVSVDLRDIRAEKMKVVSDDLIQYLNGKYNSLLDLKYVLVTGGTGACLYPYLLEYYKAANLLDEEHLMLTSGVLRGQKHSIEYAITIGAFKGLKGIVSA